VSFKENEVEFREANQELRFSLDHDGVGPRSPSDSEQLKERPSDENCAISLTVRKANPKNNNKSSNDQKALIHKPAINVMYTDEKY